MSKSFIASRFQAPNIQGLHNIFKINISYILKPGAKQQYSAFQDITVSGINFLVHVRES